MEGTVLKDQNGYFTILGNNQVLTRCRSRGALKKKTDVLVGDHVEYEANKGFEGVITKVYKRKNQLYRPPVSNVDELVLVSSICTPDLNRGLLDKMILLAENANMPPVICINKCDLDEVSAKRVCEEYEKAGYPCVYTSTYTQDGLDDLKKTFARSYHCIFRTVWSWKVQYSKLFFRAVILYLRCGQRLYRKGAGNNPACRISAI